MEENNKSKKIIIIVLVLLAILLLVGGAVYLRSKLQNPDNVEGSIGTEELIGDPEKEVIDSQGQGINLQEEALSLNLQYKDCIGWLMVPGTSIDIPIFQSQDNNRYLRNNRDNVYTGWGETFLDYRCNINNIAEKYAHYIIYGHNTEEDTCFTPLMNYKNEEFLKNHKYIEFSTLNGNYKWEIFTVFITDANDFYIDVVFENDNEYSDFLKNRKNMSMFNTGVSIDKEDTILTLSTCDYTRTEGRFVVMAKLVKE